MSRLIMNGVTRDFEAMPEIEQSRVWTHILDHGDDARFDHASAVGEHRGHWTEDCAAYLVATVAETGRPLVIA